MFGIGTLLRTTTPTRRRLADRGQFHTAVVALPPDLGPRQLPEAAATVLRSHRLTPAGTLPHFVAGTRRVGKLIDCCNGMTAGGPIRRLDLDTMRRNAAVAAAAQWHVWHHITTGTRPAQPMRVFTDRHLKDPGRLSLDQAQSEYRSQPRILAMNAYNALPHRGWELPLTELEAFQAGRDTYITLGWLAAVPGDGFAGAGDTVWMTTVNNELADQIEYLRRANQHLAGLDPDMQLAAMAVVA